MQNRANIIAWLGILLNTCAQLVLAPIIKFKTGSDGLGIWHLLFQTYCYLQLLDLGLSNGITKEISSAAGRNERYYINDLMATAHRLLSFTGIAFIIGGVGAVIILPRIIQIPESSMLEFTMALALLSLWGAAKYHFSLPLLKLRGYNRILAFNWIDLVQGAGRPILGAILALSNLGLVGIATGYAMAEAGARWLAHRLYKGDANNGKFDASIFKRIIRFGSGTGVISISTLITFYSSSLIVGWKLGITDIATYQTSIALPYLILRFAIIPFTNRFPSLIYAYEREGMAGLMARSTRCHSIVIFVSAIVLACACLMNGLFVTVWVGEELFAGYEFSLVYGLFLLFSIVRHNGYIVWQAKGKIKVMLIAHLFEIPTNIVLSILFIDGMGLAGIAYAFILAALPVTIVSQMPFFLEKKRI